MKESNTLDLLLEKSGLYLPLYGDGLATHTPMVMVALARLNASKNKLERTFENSIQGLELIGELKGIDAVTSIEDNLGDNSRFKSYLKYFSRELKVHGVELVLKRSLPLLIPGIAASAFHALIRLAYAIEANSQSEVAISLAYWCAEFQSFDLNIKPTNESLENILTRLAPIGVNHNFSPGIIVDRMTEVATLLKQEKCLIQPSSISLSRLRSFAINAFYASNNFTLLHTVTSCHALSIITPYLEEIDTALQELWKAILIAYLSTGLKYQNSPTQYLESNVDFPAVIAQTLKSNDAHTIKLVYTCLREYTDCQNPLYFAVAQRAVS